MNVNLGIFLNLGDHLGQLLLDILALGGAVEV